MSTQLQTIDDRALADPAERINEQHRLALSHRDQAIEHALEAGRLLRQVKQRLGHGEFMPWIELNCDFAQSTASRYIRAAEQISTGVEISSLRALFPSGRAPAKTIGSETPQKPGVTASDTRHDGSNTAEASPPLGVAEEDGIPSEDEIGDLERAEREYQERVDRIVASDDRLAAALEENKKLGQLNAAIVQHRDRTMNNHAADIKRLKAAQNRADRLERKLQQANATIEKLRQENEALRERIAVMEEST